MKGERATSAKSESPFITAHHRVFTYCLSLLSKVTLVTPKSRGGTDDRTTYITLTPAQGKVADSVYRGYRNWLQRFIKLHGAFLSRQDINLLRGNEIEIKSYILMRRWGQDVSPKMYRTFYRKELNDLLKQQIKKCKLATTCQRSPNNARKRRLQAGASLTIGVEEEHQIVSVPDWGLKQNVDHILSVARSSQFSREVYKSQIEAKTPVCEDISRVRKELIRVRKHLKDILPQNLAVLSAGTHPFSTWNVQQANKTARTDLFMHDMQESVRRLVTFGYHVHVGIENRDLAVQVINAARSFLPFLLAISTSSPFWEGHDTGLFSRRSTVFSALPRTGIPPTFDSFSDYEDYWDLLAKTNSFDSMGSRDPTKIWWDIRLHPKLPTIEFRICDACSFIDDAVCIAALCQAITAKLIKMLHSGIELSVPAKHIIEENKWRAIRYGSRARFIDPQSKNEVTARFLAFQLLDFVEDVLPELGSEREIRHILNIIENGSSALKQILMYRRLNGSVQNRLMKVTEWLASEFLSNGR